MASLGGTIPFCLEVAAAWTAHADDLRVLAVGPCHGGDRPRLDPEAVDAVRAGSFARQIANSRAAMARMPAPFRAQLYGGRSPDEDEARFRHHIGLLLLFTLPPGLQHRLCVAVAHAWAQRQPDAPAVVAAAANRFVPAVRNWGGEGAPALPPDRWLVDVWGPDLAVVDGHLVLTVIEADRGGTAAQVRTVDRSGRAAVHIVARRADGRWLLD